MSEMFILFQGIIGLIFFIMVCITISRIGDIHDHARRQTKLLEQIAMNTKPPEEAPKPAPAPLNYIRDEPKGGAKIFVFIGAAVVVVLVIIAIASKK